MFLTIQLTMNQIAINTVESKKLQVAQEHGLLREIMKNTTKKSVYRTRKN